MTTDVAVPIELALEEARAATASFLGCFRPTDRLVVFCHFDADGLAAGAVFGRALARMSFTDVVVVPSGRGESAFTDAARQRLEALSPAGLVITDLGVHEDGVLSEVPTLYVDHHQPEGVPEGAVVITGYRWEPIPASAWLAFELMSPLADIEDLSWIAAVGILSDLGDQASWSGLTDAKRRYTAKWLKEAVALINAARRSSAFDIDTPLDLLMHADSPKELASNDARGADKLRTYRAEVKTAMAEARKAAPIFAKVQPFALLKLDSPVQLHPLIAQQWRGRLPGYAVIAANRGYLPGVVAFSVRTARDDLNLPRLLRAVDLGATYESFGHGHDQASGGHLPVDAFDRLLTALGFNEGAYLTADMK
jgi:single-stranded-DNA-specific exonuclease